MDINWQEFQLFLAVAETGSFSAAARRLRIGQPTVSRRIAQLEEDVGKALFRRGVDGAVLTAEGDRLLPAALRMAESAGEMSRLLMDDDDAPRGIVRIAAPPGISFDFIAPFAAEVKKLHPELRLEVLAGIPYLDLVRHEADLALRTKPPAQRELTVVAELHVKAVAYATPEYVQTLPKNPGPKDIDWIAWAPPYENLPPNPQLARMIDGFEPVFSSDSYLIQFRAAECGLGAMFCGPFGHRFAPKTPLVPIPFQVDYTARMYLVCAKTMLLVPRVRTVIDLILEEIDRAPDIEPRIG